MSGDPSDVAARVASITPAAIAALSGRECTNVHAEQYWRELRYGLVDALDAAGGCRPPAAELARIVQDSRPDTDGAVVLTALGTGAFRLPCSDSDSFTVLTLSVAVVDYVGVIAVEAMLATVGLTKFYLNKVDTLPISDI